MTLRTLKDLAYVNENGVEELKEVAREYLRDLRGALRVSTTGDSPISLLYWEAQIEWIETFFNLEDDDK